MAAGGRAPKDPAGEAGTVPGGLNDAIDLIDENLTDDLTEEEKEEILAYKNDCSRLVSILSN